MKPYKIYLKYNKGISFLNDTLEVKMIHPKFNEFLYFKYFKRIKKVLNWKKKENPVVLIKIIETSIFKIINAMRIFPSGGTSRSNDFKEFLIKEDEIINTTRIIEIEWGRRNKMADTTSRYGIMQELNEKKIKVKEELAQIPGKIDLTKLEG